MDPTSLGTASSAALGGADSKVAGTMEPSTTPTVSRAGWWFTATCVAVALAASVWSTWIGVPRLADARGYWSNVDAGLRDDPVADIYGLGEPLFEALEQSIRPEDRFLIVADAPEQHEVRNYAAYRLLPAVQVSDAGRADVVVYYKVEPPETGCAPLAKDVCLVRTTR